MNGLPPRLLEMWNELSGARRAMLVGAAGALVLVAFYMYSWSSSTAYVTLFSGLDAEDSSAIVDDLRSQGVPFQLSASGTTIRVPEPQADELRINFAAQGMPNGGSAGFELFDGSTLTATDFVQRLNFQRGLEGELSRTIESFDAIGGARVHIVLPERSLFIDDERPASASVVLDIRAGGRLGSGEVRGIVRLVSGAVEGLEEAQVSIIDTDGSVLYDGAEDGEDTVGASNQLDAQRTYERTLEHDAQALLDQALGPGVAAVSVRATLNFDRSETETESFAPGQDGGVPRSSTTVTETYSAADELTGGIVPGAVANIPGADQDLPGDVTPNEGTATAYNRQESTTNFEVGRTVTRTEQAPGRVERVSVSLLLDEAVPEAQVASLTEAISAAVGVDAERGDVVAVSRLAFDRTAIDAAESAFAAQAGSQQMLAYVRLALPVIALLLAFFLFRMLNRSVSNRAYHVMDTPQLALADANAAVASVAAVHQRSLPSVGDDDARSEVEEHVVQFANQKPERVAEVLQSWLKEE